MTLEQFQQLKVGQTIASTINLGAARKIGEKHIVSHTYHDRRGFFNIEYNNGECVSSNHKSWSFPSLLSKLKDS